MIRKRQIQSADAQSPKEVAGKEPAALGRKRDHTRDAEIIEAALNILAEVDFDTMTMDMVAARAKAGKATVYRRWPSKEELVRDALIWMSRSSVDLDLTPNTGTLRDDLLALLKPYSSDHAERKMRVLAGLGSFYTKHQELAEDVTQNIFGRWTEVNRALMQRARDRGEISPEADLELACQVIVSMVPGRAPASCKKSSKDSYANLLDHIILPALKARASRPTDETR